MNDVYVVSAVRTAIGKAKRTLSQVNPVQLGALVVKEAVARAGVPGDKIEDICMGCAFPEGEQGMNMARVIGRTRSRLSPSTGTARPASRRSC
jgi:acetyl-CoA acyltransferase